MAAVPGGVAPGVVPGMDMSGITPIAPEMSNPFMAEPTKPSCGSTGPGQDYDLPLHVGALFLVLAASLFGAGFPVVAKKFKSLKIPPKVFFFCKHFGTGVLIATAFVHLLPTAFQSLNNPCLPDLFTDDYPALPGAIALGSMFMLFTIEMWLHSKMPQGHSHGGATGEEFAGGERNAPVVQRPRPPTPFVQEEQFPAEKLQMDVSMKELGYSELEPSSDMPLWFIAFYEQYVRQRDEMMRMVKASQFALPPYRKSIDQGKSSSTFDDDSDADCIEQAKQGDVVDLEYGSVDPMVYKKMNLDITLLEGGILFHSVFVGMTISITTDGFIVLLIAIMFHQTFEGLGLGSRIAAVPYPRGAWKPWILVFAFGTTAPIGQAIGLFTRNTYDPESAFALILVGFFNAFSSGLLIYAGLVDLLHADFLSDEADRTMNGKMKIWAFMYVLMGAAGMSIVGAFA